MCACDLRAQRYLLPAIVYVPGRIAPLRLRRHLLLLIFSHLRPYHYYFDGRLSFLCSTILGWLFFLLVCFLVFPWFVLGGEREGGGAHGSAVPPCLFPAF